MMQINYNELIKECYENIKSINLKDEKCYEKYDSLIKYLLNEKIKTNNLSYEDAIVIINFFSHKVVLDNGILEPLSINILSDENYKRYPTCYNNDSCTINYHENILNQLSGNLSIYGLQEMFKEICYLILDKKIRECKEFNKAIYIMAIENIIRGIEPELYQKNKKYLCRESRTSLSGFECALSCFKMYNKKLYDVMVRNHNAEIKKHKEQYKKVFNDESFYLSLDSEDSFRYFDVILSDDLKSYPNIINIYPILSVGYNQDGTKKDIIKLINERKDMLLISDQKEVDALYYAVCNYKDYYIVDSMGAKGECEKLINFIMETGETDDFVFELLKHRLMFTGEAENKIDDYIHNIRNSAMQKVLKKIQKGN